MRPTNELFIELTDTIVERVVSLIREDSALGRGSCSSWEEVSPTDYEAGERVRALIEDGTVRVEGKPTARAIFRALKAAESGFFAT